MPFDDEFEIPSHVESPFQYFWSVFPNDVIEHITYQTNLYARQKNIATKFSTTNDEIVQFLGLLMFMGVGQYPSLDDYWAQETRVPQVAAVMSSKRFRLLRRTIHFNDNMTACATQDKFFKIRPIFNYITDAFLKMPSTVRQSIDEVMIGYKGKTAGSLRQYMKDKPDKWGYKLYCRASDDGFIHDIIMYQGKETFDTHRIQLPDDQASMPVTSKIILTLSKTITRAGVSVIYADNFFSSISCVKALSQYYKCRYTGTARDNRVGKPPIMSVKAMKAKKVPRGTYDYRSSGDIIVVRWKDNKPVTLISNDKGVNPVIKVKRYCKEQKKRVEVDCPLLVTEYNAHMGGIDKSDMLVHLYKTPLKSKRWYLRLFGYVIDVCIVNAWLLYKRHCKALKESNMPLKNFRLQLSAYCRAAKPTLGRQLRLQASALEDVTGVRFPSPVKGQRCVMPQEAVRYDVSLGHYPVVVDRQTCKYCSRKNHIMRSNVACRICKIHLCLKSNSNCFVLFHTT